MATPFNEAHAKAFYWFSVGWLLAVAGSSVAAVVSGGHDWTRVARTAFSLGVMPIITGSLVTATALQLNPRHDK